MNPFKRPAPRSLRSMLTRAVLGSVFFFLIPTALMIHFIPMSADLTPPESGAAAVSAHDKATARAMAKCKSVPKGEFPTSVVVDFKGIGELPYYSKSPGQVNYLFKVAVGELALNPHIATFTLCK